MRLPHNCCCYRGLRQRYEHCTFLKHSSPRAVALTLLHLYLEGQVRNKVVALEPRRLKSQHGRAVEREVQRHTPLGRKRKQRAYYVLLVELEVQPNMSLDKKRKQWAHHALLVELEAQLHIPLDRKRKERACRVLLVELEVQPHTPLLMKTKSLRWSY